MRAGFQIDGELVPVASHFELRGRTNTIGFAMGAGGLETGTHRHREAQLLYVVRGEVTCEASGAWWIVPPGSALWVPSSVPHRIRMAAPLEGYNVFLPPTRKMPAACCTMSVTPLFRELVLRLAQRPTKPLVRVMVDELALLTVDKHRLPMPTDPRLQKLVALITANPGDGADMKTWGRRIGVAERTLNRLLVAEIGMSFGRWRQQLHVILAIQRMSRGASVGEVATDLGYEQASSFVTMFKKAMGTPPAKYMASRE